MKSSAVQSGGKVGNVIETKDTPDEGDKAETEFASEDDTAEVQADVAAEVADTAEKLDEV